MVYQLPNFHYQREATLKKTLQLEKTTVLVSLGI